MTDREQVDVSLDIGRMQGYAAARAAVCAEIVAKLEKLRERERNASPDDRLDGLDVINDILHIVRGGTP